jgi:N-acetylneuraminic acid mutarotase
MRRRLPWIGPHPTIGRSFRRIARELLSVQRRFVLRVLTILGLTASTVFAESFTWQKLAPLPDPLGVAAPFAGVSGGALLVAGGANFPDKLPWEGGKKVWHDRVWVLEKPNGAWREAGKLPRPLAYGVSITQDDSVICAGGSDADKHYAETLRLVWRNEKLTVESFPELPIPLAAAGGALVNETLIIAGGAERPGEQAATNRAFALQLGVKKLAWRELPPLPGPPRIFSVAAAHAGTFYLFGGAALAPNTEGKIVRVYLREAWSYRAEGGWKRLADLPKPSVAAPSPAPFVQGRILVLGGDDGSRIGFEPPEKHPGFPGTILAYDPELDRWSEIGQAPAPRATLPCVEWPRRFVLPSGEARPGVRSPEVWSLLK